MSFSKFRLTVLKALEGLSGPDLIGHILNKYKPKKIGISFSGGKDSLSCTLLVLDTIPGNIKAYVIFSNTTNEIPASLVYTRKMLSWLEKHYDNAIPVEVMPKRHYADFLIENFDTGARMMYVEKYWDKHNFRCCYYIKEKPIDDYIERMGIRILFLGTRGVETRQRFLAFRKTRGVSKSKDRRLIKVAPMWNWSNEEVDEYIKNHPFNPPINPIYSMGFNGTGCLLCPVKFFFGTKNDLRALQKHYPAAWRLGMALKQYFISKYTGQKYLGSINHPILKIIPKKLKRRA